MPKYRCRGTAEFEVEVVADNESDAEWSAITTSGKHFYNYEVYGCERIDLEH